MWSLDLQRIKKILPPGEALGALAIETGTCRGHGARGLAKEFPRVFTIELSEQLCEQARVRWSEEFPQIEFLQGHSVEHLKRILPSLSAHQATFFFLDAHWSGDASVDWGSSAWKGYGIDTAHSGAIGAIPTNQEQCPLLEELQTIARLCRGKAHILVDDMKNIPAKGAGLKDVAFRGEDWSHLSRDSLLSALSPRLESFVELDAPSQWFLILSAMPN